MKLIFCALLMLLVLAHARHIHPSNRLDLFPEQILLEEVNGDGEQSVDVLNMKPTRFVPLNNVLFFKNYEPCEDGFKRDILGICREVWD